MDVAIMGEGYLAVETPAGNEAYTRAGNIQVDTFGAMTINGFPVLGENGPLVVPDYQKIEISERGQVSVIPPGGGAEI
ncbi:flagellar biosynthesis protein FlgF, partial [Escherichia coli]|nr:flagellar biosynthesis protein FlgF [Escherichia coli]